MSSASLPGNGSSDDLKSVAADLDDEIIEEQFDDEDYLDDEYDEDIDGEYDEDFDDDEYEEGAPRKKKKSRRRIKMHCFNCNRQEGHFTAYKGRWFFSYFQGLTFGIANLIGPFKCQCCGHNRLMCSDLLNLRKWFLPKGKKSTTRKKSSSKKRSRSR